MAIFIRSFVISLTISLLGSYFLLGDLFSNKLIILGICAIFSLVIALSQNRAGSITSDLSIQMISRPLMFPEEITQIKKNDFICYKAGQHPVRLNAPYFGTYIKNTKNIIHEKEDTFQKIKTLKTTDFESFQIRNIRLEIGMFD